MRLLMHHCKTVAPKIHLVINWQQSRMRATYYCVQYSEPGITVLSAHGLMKERQYTCIMIMLIR